MTFCQAVLKSQNPTIEGFECTLFQAKEREKKKSSGFKSRSLDTMLNQ